MLLEQPPGWSEYWGVQLHAWAVPLLWPAAVGVEPIGVDALVGPGTARSLHSLLARGGDRDADVPPRHGPTALDDPAHCRPLRTDDDRAVALTAWVAAAACPLDRDARLVRLTVRWADARADPPTVAAMAAHGRVSVATLGRVFRRVVGVGPKDFLALHRFARFAVSVVAPGSGGQATLSTLSGYYDQSHAIRDVRRLTGVTPEVFRRRFGGIAELLSRA